MFSPQNFRHATPIYAISLTFQINFDEMILQYLHLALTVIGVWPLNLIDEFLIWLSILNSPITELTRALSSTIPSAYCMALATHFSVAG